MAKIGTRKTGDLKAISTAPSMNKTPAGSAVVVLPYPTIQSLDNSSGVVPTVKLKSCAAYVLNQTTQPTCRGDGPGTLKGIRSNTVDGEVKPTEASGSVRAGGKPMVRLGDSNTMNGGNNPGIYLVVPAVSATPPPQAAKGADANPAEDATPAEQGFMDKVRSKVQDLAQGYKDNVSGSLHEGAGKAMATGGTVAGAGGVTMLAGGGVALTGVGLPVAAAMEVGGAAAVTVGGVVGGVGSAVSAGATVLDSAADWVLTGRTNVVGTATKVVENAVVNRITNMIPGSKAVVGEARALRTEAKAETTAARNAVRQEERTARPNTSSGGRDNVNVPGRNRDNGRCRLRPYKERCPNGQTPHHVVPDHCFKQPGDNGAYYNGAIRHGDGLSVCVDGKGKFNTPDGGTTTKTGRRLIQYYPELAQHGQIHARFDIIERGLGKIGTPKGTASLGQLEDIGAGVVSQVTGCNKEDLKRQLREYHQSKGLPPETKLRADPSGAIKNLDASKMGVPRRSTGASID